MAPIIRLLKFIHSFKFILALIFIWKFHNIIYSLIAFISMFIFNVELKEFLNTIELIYLTFYNYLLEFKLDTYSSFYKNFNPNSFNDLILDIRNYVNNSSFRLKNKILKSFDLESSQKVLLDTPQGVNDKFVEPKDELSKPQFTSPIIDSLDKGSFRDKYKLTLIEDYIKFRVWDIIYSPYFYVPVTITTLYLGYSFSNYWLPIIPYIFSILAGDKPSDDTDGNFGDTTPKAAQDNDLLAESMITLTNFETANNTPVNSPQLYPTSELPSITITSPTESIASTISSTSTELQRHSPTSSNIISPDTSANSSTIISPVSTPDTSANSPISDTISPVSDNTVPSVSPTRTFSSGSFNA
jgi:hypothetical protein